jgi:hypothetical protein
MVNAYSLNIDHDNAGARIAYLFKKEGFSIRCIKD